MFLCGDSMFLKTVLKHQTSEISETFELWFNYFKPFESKGVELVRSKERVGDHLEI